jgi:hypothetical protein
MKKSISKLMILAVMLGCLFFVKEAKADDGQNCIIQFFDCAETYCYNPINGTIYWDCINLQCGPKFDRCLDDVIF